jgi:hypothetical protein
MDHLVREVQGLVGSHLGIHIKDAVHEDARVFALTQDMILVYC